MTEKPWTPGPWEDTPVVDPDTGRTTLAVLHTPAPHHYVEVVETPDVCGGEAIHGDGALQRAANARLIAASPELVELVREYAWGNPTLQTDKRADALLAKIYGDSQ